MAADPFASVSALRAAVDRGLADAATVLKARDDLDASQIDTSAPAPVDDGSDEAADDLDSPGSSREATPDGSGGPSSALSSRSLSRYSTTYALTPICGAWSGAGNAVSGNVGRLLICLRKFVEAVADLPQQQAATSQQQAAMQQQLLDWDGQETLSRVKAHHACLRHEFWHMRNPHRHSNLDLVQTVTAECPAIGCYQLKSVELTTNSSQF